MPKKTPGCSIMKLLPLLSPGPGVIFCNPVGRIIPRVAKGLRENLSYD